MKILLLFSYRVSLETWNKSGLLSREISLYIELLKKNIDISFLTFGDEKDLKYSGSLGKIKVIPSIKYIKSKNRKLQFLKSLILPFKLRKVFKNIDIIKTNQFGGSWIACVAKIFYNKKIVVRGGYEYFRNFISSKRVLGLNNTLIYHLRYISIFILELIVYHLADAIILTSKSNIQFIIKKFKLRNKIRDIFLLYNFIDTNLFKPKPVKKKDKHILFVGRILEIKNLMNTILAFRELKGYTLDIVGDGYFKEQLKKKIKEFNLKVNFLGKFSNEQLPDILNQYPIFILPSIYENNPKVLLEAMSCGIACIGTNVRGINEIIKHKENGYLCGTDSKSIKEAILTVNNDKDFMAKIGKSARQFILNNCSLTSIVEKEYRVYKKVLN